MSKLTKEELSIERARVRQICEENNIKEDIIKQLCRKGQEPLGCFEAIVNNGEHDVPTAIEFVLNNHYVYLGEIPDSVLENTLYSYLPNGDGTFSKLLAKKYIKKFQVYSDYKPFNNFHLSVIGDSLYVNQDQVVSPYGHWYCLLEENSFGRPLYFDCEYNRKNVVKGE